MTGAGPHATQRAAADEPAITGEVLTPSGSPVTGGTVALMMSTGINKAIATIDRTGHFRIVPDSQGANRLFIAVPGFAPYRAIVSLPLSRRMTLPPIMLTEATFVRVRFVTVDGDPLGVAGVRRTYLDRDGVPISDPLDHTREQVEADGTVTIGPLPLGRMMWGFDRPPLAPTRLPDITVGATGQVIDRGTIAIQPSAQLQIQIFDDKGQPVPQHDAWIEDAVQPSPLSYLPVKTDVKGRASFARLGRGRYRVFTRAERCADYQLTISQLASAGSADSPPIRMVIGGRAALRITTPLGALLGRQARLAPDSPPDMAGRPRFIDAAGRRLAIEPTTPSCPGVTDSDGRVVFASFPPGPAQLRVELFNSTYMIRVNVPDNGREIAVAIPDGLTPVKVVDRNTQRPIASARAAWVGTGGRVEAMTTANGDALLEAVGMNGGTLTISDRDYQTLEGAFEVSPDTVQEVALTRLPPEGVRVSIVSDDHKPIANAIVTLLGGGELVHFTATDAKGMASFNGIGSGALNFTAYADSFAPATLQIAEDARASIRVVMTPRKD